MSAKVHKEQEDRELSRKFEVKLIKEVEKHLCLYARTDPSYSNKVQKQKAWNAISSAVGMRVERCQKKWCNIRDFYRKSIRGKRQGAIVTWVHFDLLKFLDPYIYFQESKVIPYESIKSETKHDITDHCSSMLENAIKSTSSAYEENANKSTTPCEGQEFVSCNDDNIYTNHEPSIEQGSTESYADATIVLNETLKEILNEIKVMNQNKKMSMLLKEKELQQLKLRDIEENRLASIQTELKRKELEISQLKLKRFCIQCSSKKAKDFTEF